MSGKNFFIIERKVRKRRLLEIIQQHPELTPGRLKGLYSSQTGLGFRKIEEYLSELEESGLIEVTEEHIVSLTEKDPVKVVKD